MTKRYGFFAENGAGRVYLGGDISGWPTDTDIRRAVRHMCSEDYCGVIRVQRGELYVCVHLGPDGDYIQSELYLGEISERLGHHLSTKGGN